MQCEAGPDRNLVLIRVAGKVQIVLEKHSQLSSLEHHSTSECFVALFSTLTDILLFLDHHAQVLSCSSRPPLSQLMPRFSVIVLGIGLVDIVIVDVYYLEEVWRV